MVVIIWLFQLLIVVPTIQALFSAIAPIGKAVDNRTLLRHEQSVFTHIYTTGQIKQTKYDWINGIWTGSVFVPVGTCTDTETVNSKRNSYRLTKVLDPRDGKLILVTNQFLNINCSGPAVQLAASVLGFTIQTQFELTTSVVAQQKEDQQLPAHVIIKTYLSSNGCTGTPAQVELLPQSCAVRLSPLNSYGTFACNNKENVTVYTRYGDFNNTAYTYPDCTKYPEIQLETDEYPVTTELQSLECTRVDSVSLNKNSKGRGDGGDDALIMYQTIECSQ